MLIKARRAAGSVRLWRQFRQMLVSYRLSRPPRGGAAAGDKARQAADRGPGREVAQSREHQAAPRGNPRHRVRRPVPAADQRGGRPARPLGQHPRCDIETAGGRDPVGVRSPRPARRLPLPAPAREPPADRVGPGRLPGPGLTRGPDRSGRRPRSRRYSRSRRRDPGSPRPACGRSTTTSFFRNPSADGEDLDWLTADPEAIRGAARRPGFRRPGGGPARSWRR